MTTTEPTPEAVADMDRLREEVERLRRWKTEASEVILGLQDLGNALGVPLGRRITGTLATEIAGELRVRTEKAEAKVTRVEALRDAEIADVIESRVRAARADVRCLDCNLRHGERQEYGCHWSGQAHSYSEGDLAAAEEVERSGSVEHVTLSVADLRAALDLDPEVSTRVKTRIEWFDADGKKLGEAEVDGDARYVAYASETGGSMPLAPKPPAGAAHAVARLVVEGA